MKLYDLIKHHTTDVRLAGVRECGEKKYDLITDDNLAYPPVHESTIRKVKPELLGG